MSSSVIRREDQPVCEPWQPDSFDTIPHGMTHEHYAAALPTLEQISGIQEQAMQEGYQAGYAEGLLQGQAQAAHEAARLGALADAFAQETGKADEIISQQILELAIDLAHALLMSTLAVQPERVIPIVREAVRYLPVLHQPALIYLNPDDAGLVREQIGDELEKMGWQLTSDATLECGGCRIETANNRIDASLPTRWQRLAAALGHHSDWLAA